MFRENPDGTLAIEVSQLQLTTPQTPIPTPVMLDDLSAVQTAIATILNSLVFYSIDRKAYVVDRQVQSGKMTIQRIYYDTPRIEDDMKYPSACILTTDKTTIDIDDTNYQQLDEDTLNQYGQDTIVQKLGYAKTPIQVILWFGHKDDRAAARKTCVEVFSGELFDERPGRRVVMPYYYHRICVMNLTDVAYQDDPEKSKANEFPLVLSLETETELVRLVQAPAVMRTPMVAVSNLTE